MLNVEDAPFSAIPVGRWKLGCSTKRTFWSGDREPDCSQSVLWQRHRRHEPVPSSTICV
jgi:hypothetical protein